MIYEYTTYALNTHNGFLFFIGFGIALLVFGLGIVSFSMENPHETHIPLKKVGYSATFGFVAAILFIVVAWGSPYPNEQVIATLVDTDEATYKSGKHSYVKSATVTYQLKDGGLVTFRADGGTAWYPEIILYKNPKR